MENFAEEFNFIISFNRFLNRLLTYTVFLRKSNFFQNFLKKNSKKNNLFYLPRKKGFFRKTPVFVVKK